MTRDGRRTVKCLISEHPVDLYKYQRAAAGRSDSILLDYQTFLLVDMLAKSSAALWALLGLVTAAPNHAPTVVLRPGRVIGTTTGLPSSTATVNKFLGIPFAVTPPKRFLPPERLARYDGPVDATRHPPLCIQQNYGW